MNGGRGRKTDPKRKRNKSDPAKSVTKSLASKPKKPRGNKMAEKPGATPTPDTTSEESESIAVTGDLDLTPAALPPILRIPVSAEQPPWLGGLLMGITQSFESCMDKKFKEQENTISKNTATTIVCLEKNVSTKFANQDAKLATHDDALKLIGGTFDILEQEVRENESSRLQEAKDMNHKIDQNRKLMENELSKLQAHVRSQSPASHPPHPPPTHTLTLAPHCQISVTFPRPMSSSC